MNCPYCEEELKFDRSGAAVCCGYEFNEAGEVVCVSCKGFGGFDLGGGDSIDCGHCKGTGFVASDYSYPD